MGFWRSLPWTAAAVTATAATGSVATRETRSAWYDRLEKPPFQPPALVFPIAWTVLYATIAGASAAADGAASTQLERIGASSAAHEIRSRRRRFRGALIVNLVLNAGWSWMFFAFKRLPESTAIAAALAASSIDLARRAGTEHRGAGLALIPYAAWTVFATVLTASIWRRNPHA